MQKDKKIYKMILVTLLVFFITTNFAQASFLDSIKIGISKTVSVFNDLTNILANGWKEIKERREKWDDVNLKELWDQFSTSGKNCDQMWQELQKREKEALKIYNPGDPNDPPIITGSDQKQIDKYEISGDDSVIEGDLEYAVSEINDDDIVEIDDIVEEPYPEPEVYGIDGETDYSDLPEMETADEYEEEEEIPFQTPSVEVPMTISEGALADDEYLGEPGINIPQENYQTTTVYDPSLIIPSESLIIGGSNLIDVSPQPSPGLIPIFSPQIFQDVKNIFQYNSQDPNKKLLANLGDGFGDGSLGIDTSFCGWLTNQDNYIRGSGLTDKEKNEIRDKITKMRAQCCLVGGLGMNKLSQESGKEDSTSATGNYIPGVCDFSSISFEGQYNCAKNDQTLQVMDGASPLNASKDGGLKCNIKANLETEVKDQIVKYFWIIPYVTTETQTIYYNPICRK